MHCISILGKNTTQTCGCDKLVLIHIILIVILIVIVILLTLLADANSDTPGTERKFNLEPFDSNG